MRRRSSSWAPRPSREAAAQRPLGPQLPHAYPGGVPNCILQARRSLKVAAPDRAGPPLRACSSGTLSRRCGGDDVPEVAVAEGGDAPRVDCVAEEAQKGGAAVDRRAIAPCGTLLEVVAQPTGVCMWLAGAQGSDLRRGLRKTSGPKGVCPRASRAMPTSPCPALLTTSFGAPCKLWRCTHDDLANNSFLSLLPKGHCERDTQHRDVGLERLAAHTGPIQLSNTDTKRTHTLETESLPKERRHFTLLTTADSQWGASYVSVSLARLCSRC